MTFKTFQAGATRGALKYLLLGFVFLSAAAVVHKIAGAPCCSKNKAQEELAGAAALAAQPAPKPEPTNTSAAKTKTAVVYYFYTNTRCSSCKTIEAYTRAAVDKNLASGYKGWGVVFKGVNVEEGPGKHFVQDYWLNTKSVVVQKFSEDKPLKWVKLEKVWQFLGDKEVFINYITDETHKFLDEK